ncbi:MAG: aminotransferase class V-fold PLP-dependent enzyme [Slackia sp.]
MVYDLGMVADFCRREGLFLIVDAVSAFLTEAIDMAAAEVDVLITGSQKALAVPPGISVLALAPSALERVQRIDPHCMYFDLKDALKNGERGQTPFTPAVGILLQINERLRHDEMGVQANSIAWPPWLRISAVASSICHDVSRRRRPTP